jgi:hypothetical protein
VALNQIIFLVPGQFLNGKFSPLGSGSIRSFFKVDQFHRASKSGVKRSSARIMFFHSPLRVGCPPGVEGAICTFHYIAVVCEIRSAIHFLESCGGFGGWNPNSWESKPPLLGICGPSISIQRFSFLSSHQESRSFCSFWNRTSNWS